MNDRETARENREFRMSVVQCSRQIDMSGKLAELQLSR
jgi:hypothetical protein